MKVLLLQQPKSFSNYPKWIEEIQERFNCLEVMVFTSNDRAAHHSWPSFRHQGNRGFRLFL